MNYNRNLFQQINRLTNEVTGSYRSYTPPEPPVVTDTVTITTEPTDITCYIGDTATLSIVAVSDDETATLSYQWQILDNETWLNVSGATESSYVVPTSGIKEDSYRCQVTSDKGGSATSTTATVTVQAIPIDTVTITTQPQTATGYIGDTITLSVVAESDDETATLSYQWQADGTDISGATSSTYTVPTSSTGSVTYTVVITSDKGGTATSDGAVVTVSSDTVTISVQPQSASGNTGDVITLSVTASSDVQGATLSYQWQIKNGSTYDDISGATASTYTVPTTTAGTQRYRVVVTSDKGGTATSNYADVTLVKPRRLSDNTDYKILWYIGATQRYATNSVSDNKISSTATESDGAIFHVSYYGNDEYIIYTEINGDTYFLAYESDMLYFTNADVYTWKDSNLSGTAGLTIMTSDGYYLVYNGIYLTLTTDTPTYVPSFIKQPILLYESDFSSSGDGWATGNYYDSENHWIYNYGSSAKNFTKNLYSTVSSTPPEGAPILPCTLKFTYTFNPVDLSNSADVVIKFMAYRRNPSMQQEVVTAKTVTVSTSGTTTGTDTFTLTSSYDGMWFTGIQVSMPATGYRENVAMSYFKLELIT